MKKNNALAIEKIVIFVFLIIGILIVIRMNEVYEKRHSEKLAKDKINNLNEVKKEKESRLPYDPNRKITTVNIEISDEKITPDTISANLGEELKIHVRVIEGYHNLSIEFYNLKSENIATGKTELVNFIATQSGVFRIFSNTGKYESMEPEGILIVK